MTAPVRVTAYDPETGDTQTSEIVDDFCITVAGTAEITSWIVHANGTHQLTIKNVRRPSAGAS